MDIFLGTTSEQKLGIIKSALEKEYKNIHIVPTEVDSGIANQPIDEITTIQGSINRAKNAVKKNKDIYDISIGMEAGLVSIEDLYHLVCVVSILDSNNQVYIGISGKMPLPREVSDCVKNGEEFGIVIREFEKKYFDQNSEIRVLVTELINRTRGFSEAFQRAFLQYKNKNLF